jgi:hypothetical protein
VSGGGDLFGRAQSLLDALREKGLLLPNPARVDGDSDAVAALAAEIRVLAGDAPLALSASFDAEGVLVVRAAGPGIGRAASIEVRAFAPWREGPAVRRAPVRGAETRVAGVERDGPANVAVVDVAGTPLAWCTVEPG